MAFNCKSSLMPFTLQIIFMALGWLVSFMILNLLVGFIAFTLLESNFYFSD